MVRFAFPPLICTRRPGRSAPHAMTKACFSARDLDVDDHVDHVGGGARPISHPAAATRGDEIEVHCPGAEKPVLTMAELALFELHSDLARSGRPSDDAMSAAAGFGCVLHAVLRAGTSSWGFLPRGAWLECAGRASVGQARCPWWSAPSHRLVI